MGIFGNMQALLFLVAIIYNFVIGYCITKLILRIHGETVTLVRQVLFVFIGTVVLYTGASYLVYVVGGMVSLNSLTFLLVISPNPILAIIWCLLGISLLEFPPVRSIEIMGIAYLYHSSSIAISSLIGVSFFPQTGEGYNYVLNVLTLISGLAVFLLSFFITQIILNRHSEFIIPKTYSFSDTKKDFIFFVIKAIIVYACMVMVPLFVAEPPIAYCLVTVIVVFCLVCTLFYRSYVRLKTEIDAKNSYIASLIKSSDEFRAVKHDFYNILHTYSGFFELEDYEGCKNYHASLMETTMQAGESIDLNRKLSENPVLVTLLSNKKAKAQELNVVMETTIKCSMKNLPIDDFDFSRVLACLLDNAIEAAEESTQRRVSYIMRRKGKKTRTITITNSVAHMPDSAEMFTLGKSSKENHEGIGLNNVRKTINRYGNCTFRMDVFEAQVVAYLEFRED